MGWWVGTQVSYWVREYKYASMAVNGTVCRWAGDYACGSEGGTMGLWVGRSMWW